MMNKIVRGFQWTFLVAFIIVSIIGFPYFDPAVYLMGFWGHLIVGILTVGTWTTVVLAWKYMKLSKTVSVSVAVSEVIAVSEKEGKAVYSVVDVEEPKAVEEKVPPTATDTDILRTKSSRDQRRSLQTDTHTRTEATEEHK